MDDEINDQDQLQNQPMQPAELIEQARPDRRPLTERIYSKFRRQAAEDLGEEALGIEAPEKISAIAPADTEVKTEVIDVPATVWGKEKAALIGHAVNKDHDVGETVGFGIRMRQKNSPEGITEGVSNLVRQNERKASAYKKEPRFDPAGHDKRGRKQSVDDSISDNYAKIAQLHNPERIQAEEAEYAEKLKDTVNQAASPYEEFYETIKALNPQATEHMTVEEFMQHGKQYIALVEKQSQDRDTLAWLEDLTFGLRGSIDKATVSSTYTVSPMDEVYDKKVKNLLGRLEIDNEKRREIKELAKLGEDIGSNVTRKDVLDYRYGLLQYLEDLVLAEQQRNEQDKAAFLAKFGQDFPVVSAKILAADEHPGGEEDNVELPTVKAVPHQDEQAPKVAHDLQDEEPMTVDDEISDALFRDLDVDVK